MLKLKQKWLRLLSHISKHKIKRKPMHKKRVKIMNKPKSQNESKQKRSLVQCKKLLIVLCISTLALTQMGCQQSTPLVIPANLITPCPELQKLESGQGKDILPIMIDDRRKYVDCQQRHKAIVSIVESKK